MRESLARSRTESPETPADAHLRRDPVAPARAAPRAAAETMGPVEEIAQAYLATTHGDAGIALRCAITDALSDLLEAERRARENSRLISRGYVRDAMGRR